MTKLGALIVELLERNGPMHTPGICKALDRDYASTVPIMTALVKEGAVRALGTAAKFRLTDVKSSAPVYGATGIKVVTDTRKLQRVGNSVPPPHYTGKPRQRTKSGSGVIAGPITHGRGSVWGAGRV